MNRNSAADTFLLCIKETIRTIKWQGFSCCGHKDYDFILMNAVF